MSLKTKFAALVGVVLVGCLTAGVSLRANGAEFFEMENDGRIVLYYFGNVKDTNGNVLDKVMVTIEAKNAGLRFPFRNVQPGHFRSPDIGKAIEGAGKEVDPTQIQITLTKSGYKLVQAPPVPNKMGAVDLGLFVMEATGS
jgi:hypothetical protein